MLDRAAITALACASELQRRLVFRTVSRLADIRRYLTVPGEEPGEAMRRSGGDGPGYGRGRSIVTWSLQAAA